MLQGHEEVLVAATTIITPLAAEESALEGSGSRGNRQWSRLQRHSLWAQAQERSDPLVQSALRAVQREGMMVGEFPVSQGTSFGGLGSDLGRALGKGTYRGLICFCGDPGLVCCVANKVAGVRAVAVTTVAQAVRGLRTLAANLLAVEMPGRTLFEVRQILHLLRDGKVPLVLRAWREF